MSRRTSQKDLGLAHFVMSYKEIICKTFARVHVLACLELLEHYSEQENTHKRPSKATGDIAQKCGDNLFSIHLQPTKTGRKRVTICDRDNPFLLSTKQRFLALLFATATSLPDSVITL